MIEVMDAGLAVAQGPAALPDGAALRAIEAAQVGPTLQQALAQGGGCGCGSRGATGAAAILDAPMAAILLPETLLEDREPEYRRSLDGIGARQTALWLVAPEAELLLDAPAPAIDGKVVGPQSTTLSGGDGTSWVDSNGNGKYDPGEEIIITGERDRDVDEGGGDAGGGSLGYGDDPLLGDGNGTGTGGGMGGPLEEPEDMPCVEASPEGVSLADINREALKASALIAEKNDETFEYGVIIYVKDGVVMSTPVFTQHRTDQIDWNAGIPLIPDGARIVAILHNHPDENGIEDAIPSTYDMQLDDWDSYQSLVDWSGVRGITVDPNLLMYIYTNENTYGGGPKTRVYDKTDKGAERPQCPLE